MLNTGAVDFAAIVRGLRLAVFVLQRTRIVYQNEAAVRLAGRLQKDYQVDLAVMLRDHVLRMGELDPAASPTSAVTLLTDPRGEPLYVHVLPIGTDPDTPTVAVCVRELGIEREAFARRYGLSPREAEVAELVLRGYGNPAIASMLGIAPATAKRHLTRIFDKIGVDSRTQLVSRLA
ncbi:MAG TPA: helix-turn-helix transcriptional regulator [Vicinamibacterales bacterium]|jgi:DNA-binding CsgD family transcriptional regulator|nr:helix-turn-helix transcriptional regulator [Vicinamibacterales bacterium]